MPTGQIQLNDGARPIAAALLVNGHAILKTSLLTAGVHSFTAAYSGDARHGVAVSPLVLEVVPAGNACKP
jgi:hypothetical protein